MAILYAIAQSDATTETPEIPDLSLVVIKGTTGASDVGTQTALGFLGRDRSPTFSEAQTKLAAIAYSRIHYQSVAASPLVSTSDLKLIAVSPSLGIPNGVLFWEGHSRFGDERLARAMSYYLPFEITGKRISYLEVTLKISTLTGQLKIFKTSKSDGVIIDETPVPNQDGTETITGYVVILPEDINYQQRGDLELAYLFEIGNGSTRQHKIQSGFVTFY